MNAFNEYAFLYLRAGWSPIPLPKNAKWPPPDGFTGARGAIPSAANIQSWIDDGKYAAGKAKVYPNNIGLRMLPNQLGIDVDMYVKKGQQKAGRESLAELEAKWGPLPRTRMTSARTDGSGIRFFTIPEGLAWPGAPMPGIELIQFSHRYAVAPPSVNPEANNARYAWLWSDGEEFEGIPEASENPTLPDAWIQGLTNGELSTVIERLDMGRAHALDWMQSHAADQEMCGYMTKVMRQHVDALVTGAQGARHDAAVQATQAVAHLAAEGHAGLRTALSGLHAAFAYVTSGEDRPGEWERMVTGAIGVAAARQIQCLGDPCKDPYTGRDNVHTPKGPGLASVHVLQPGKNTGNQGYAEIPTPQHESGIWNMRPELIHIRELARAQLASPFSVLGVILARVVSSVPSFVVLPPVVGGYGSLNSFYALVGKPGAGKGISERVASLGFDIAEPAPTFNAGSGEGLAHLYARRIRVKKEDGGGTAVERIRDSVLLSVPEVDSLAALGGRSGSTLISQLRQAWSGEHLGFAYADPDKALPIEEHSYRLTLLVGVQPGRAGAILNDSDGGTPQRFVWLPTRLEQDAPDDFVDPPDPWQWENPGPWKANSRGRVVLEIPDYVRDFVRKENARLRRNPDEFELDEHHYYAQLKLAAAFALLARRQYVNPEDWELAAEMMRVSLAERNYVVGVLAQAAAQAAERQGFTEGYKAVAAEKVISDSAIKRICRNLIRKASSTEWLPTRHFYNSMTSRDKPYFEEAMERLVSTGMFEARETAGRGGNGTEYKIIGGSS